MFCTSSCHETVIRHYLLGQTFIVVTDHAPLQWLCSQKTQGLIARWTLALQEFQFNIEHRRGVDNGNADGLSQKAHEGVVGLTAIDDLLLANIGLQQEDDPVLRKVRDALQTSSESRPCGSQWCRPNFRRYRQCGTSSCFSMVSFTGDTGQVRQMLKLLFR